MKRRMMPMVVALGLALAACGETEAESKGAAEAPHAEEKHQGEGASDAEEAVRPESRLAITHDGGITVLRAGDGEVVGEIELDGFLRLNQAGDGRHALVTTGKGFEVLDLGAWTQAHGDHGHSYTAEPRMTGTVFPAELAGHAVVHADRTVLFADGTGEITAFDPHHLADGEVETTEFATEHAHHGVALIRADGALVATDGTTDERSSVTVRAVDGEEIARYDDCPGVHGEAVAGETVAFGCEDGVLLLKGDEFTKVDAPGDYARIGNLAGSDDSPVLLGDYKVDPDAELERPTRVTLIDTETEKLRLVDLGASYSFRSLGRGAGGEALVLGTDGGLRVIDPATGKIDRTVKVTAPWREPSDWQQPRPTLRVVGEIAWVSEPKSKQVHAVDVVGGRVVASWDLPQVPNELLGVTG
ncbi:zinc metallochaperone AztD [Nocardioides sp. Bht2]|uniref:zinc metallochaperone AztD n=1 Tax=Nocardioides sp. Bht2 TaxID=3392297 RepID=UPI0039B49FAA